MGSNAPAGSRGFSAHPGRLGSAADALKTAGDDVASIHDTLSKLDMGSGDVLGDYGAADAAKAFWSAWQDELGVDADALHDLSGKVQTSADNYSGTDTAISGKLRGE